MSAQTPAPCQRRARLGWISAPAELVDPLVARKSAADSGSPTLDQLTLVGSWHPVRTSGTSPLPAAPTGAAATSSCARWQRSSPGCRSSAPLRGCNCSLCSPRTPMTSPSPRQPPPRASTSPYCRRCTLGQARNRACWSASADSLNTESLPQSTRYGPCSATLAQHSRPEHISARSAPPPPTPPGPSGLCKAARAREECGGLTTELTSAKWHQGDRAGWTAAPRWYRRCHCVAADTRKSNGLRTRQRPGGRYHRMLLSRVLSWPVPAFRARIGRKVRKG
jgi:hypothetical protein